MLPTVLISGVGLITARGSGPEAVWTDLVEARTDRSRAPIAEVPSAPFLSPMQARKMDRFGRLSVMAAGMALQDAGLYPVNDPERAGCMFVSALGPLNTVLQFLQEQRACPGGVSPMRFANTVANAALGHVCVVHKLKGPSTMFSGPGILDTAILALQAHKADAICVIGCEELCQPYLDGLRPEQRGFVASEASVALILERSATAYARGRRPYCELAALAEARDVTARPDFSADSATLEAFLRSMSQAIDRSGREIPDAVLAAANGCPEIDAAEAGALSALFTRVSRSVPVTGPKTLFGETFGASEVLNVAVGALSVGRRRLPCGQPVQSVLVNSYHLGGVCSSAILQQCQEVVTCH